MTEPTLTQQLFNQLQGAPMQQIAQRLGTTPEQASSAVSQALPLLMSAFGNQAAQPQGTQNLLGSLGSGGLGGMLGSLLGGGSSAGGGGLGGILGQVLGGGNQSGMPGRTQPAGGTGIPGGEAETDALLGSLFGGRQARAEEGLGKASGLGSSGAHNLLLMLAPIVISFLGTRFLQGRQSSAQTPDTHALDEALVHERQELDARGAGQMLNSLLDQNGDGKLDMHDLVKLGSSLFGGRR